MDANSFRSRGGLHLMSALAVATSLAGSTAAVFSKLFNDPAYGLYTIGSTLLVALIWVRVLRWPKTVGRSRVRVGWLLSIPLAALNSILATVTMSILLGQFSLDKLLLTSLQALLFGSVFWLPSWVFTLVCFGAPIAWAQRLAKAGLAGEERGEAVVGGISALLAAGAFMTMYFTPHETMSPNGALGLQLTTSTASWGVFLGALTLLLSWSRENGRRKFVADVEAGKVPKFRVDSTPEGKVLIRVVSQDNSYRVGDYQEEVAALTHEGQLVRPLAGKEE